MKLWFPGFETFCGTYASFLSHFLCLEALSGEGADHGVPPVASECFMVHWHSHSNVHFATEICYQLIKCKSVLGSTDKIQLIPLKVQNLVPNPTRGWVVGARGVLGLSLKLTIMERLSELNLPMMTLRNSQKHQKKWVSRSWVQGFVNGCLGQGWTLELDTRMV